MFTLFPELPSEIRLKIWKLCLPGPRTLTLKFMVWGPDLSGWSSSDSIPVALHICYDSRQEALKFYRPAFGSLFQQSTIYIDFSIDTVCFGNLPEVPFDTKSRFEPRNYLLDLLLGGDYHSYGEKVERMILEIDYLLYDRRPFCWGEIRLLPALKELTLITFDEDELADELMGHFRSTFGTVARAHPEWAIPDIKVVAKLSGKEWGIVKVPEVEQSAE